MNPYTNPYMFIDHNEKPVKHTPVAGHYVLTMNGGGCPSGRDLNTLWLLTKKPTEKQLGDMITSYYRTIREVAPNLHGELESIMMGFGKKLSDGRTWNVRLLNHWTVE